MDEKMSNMLELKDKNLNQYCIKNIILPFVDNHFVIPLGDFPQETKC